MKSRMIYSVSMAIFGTLGIFTRNIAVSSGELALYRAILAAALIVVFLLVTRQKINFGLIKKAIPLLLLSGAAMGINWILLFEAYRYTTISMATLSYYFAPVLITIICPILFKEKLTPKQIFCFCMSTLGMAMILGAGGLSHGGSDLKGILFGLGAAVFYATVVILNKYIKDVTGIHRTLFQFFAAIIVLSPYVALTSGCNLAMLDGLGWGCLLVVGLVHTGITYCMYFSTMKDMTGQQVSILSYIDPLVAVFISLLVLGESMTFLQVLGGVFILGFTLWNEIGGKK